MKAYQQLLGLIIKEIPVKNGWSNNILLYQVYQKDKLIGEFYLDLFPRKGKYSHACCLGIPHWENNISTAVIICNFEENNGLSFDEVETFFHEFGHAIHFLLGDKYPACINSFNIEEDFIESPSQMQELFLYDERILNLLLPENKKFPIELLNSIKKAEKFFAGLNYCNQITMGIMDINIHISEQKLLSTYEEHLFKYSGLVSKVPINKLSSFIHLMGEYECRYYGYLWSKIISHDIFNNIENRGIIYRDVILSKGATEKATILIHNFLQRDFNSKAFLQWYGI